MSLFIKLSIRNFLKSAGLNSLNIFGLSLGLIAALLITVYADHEYHYDQFHTNSSNIYRMEGKTNSDIWFSNLGMEHSRELVAGSYPEVINRVQLNTAQRGFYNFEDKKFAESNVLQTNPGSHFFDFFSFDVLEGDKQSMLTDPYSVILSESTAAKYFGSSSPIGKTFSYDTIHYKVTGVIQDIPSDTHLNFDVLYTNPRLYERDHFHTQNYLQLQNDVNVDELEEKILAMDVARDEFHALSDIELMPVTDIHLYSNASFGTGGKG
ncbi:MAG: ABC transporter permease, partial [Ekhidna sp.]